MKIYIGTDHAGYETKEMLKIYFAELGYEVDDKGAFTFNDGDDYPDYVLPVAEAVAKDEGSFGIVLGASGQGEAMCANRVPGIRAALYYGSSAKEQIDNSGHTLNIIASSRAHNNANILALGMHFLTQDEAREAVRIFLNTPFSLEDRHIRRIKKLG